MRSCGGHGTTAALALLNDAVKKGGVMASSRVGGLSGAFIPVSEDAGMIDAARCGALSIEKLEAMTAVCSVGLDMIAIPGDTPAEVIAAIIADEAAIGMVNSKTTAVRVIPAIGRKAGEELQFGGLFGSGPIMPVNTWSPRRRFISRGGRIPAPLAEPQKLTGGRSPPGYQNAPPFRGAFLRRVGKGNRRKTGGPFQDDERDVSGWQVYFAALRKATAPAAERDRTAASTATFTMSLEPVFGMSLPSLTVESAVASSSTSSTSPSSEA